MTAEPATLSDLLAGIERAPDAELVFASGEGETRPGYHLTELRLAEIRAIDCGHGLASWAESQLQILDARPGAAPDMTGAKFAAIARAALAALPGIGEAPLAVEFAPGNGALRRHRVREVTTAGDRTVVSLVPERAVCKPSLRAASGTFAKAPSCC